VRVPREWQSFRVGKNELPKVRLPSCEDTTTTTVGMRGVERGGVSFRLTQVSVFLPDLSSKGGENIHSPEGNRSTEEGETWQGRRTPIPSVLWGGGGGGPWRIKGGFHKPKGEQHSRIEPFPRFHKKLFSRGRLLKGERGGFPLKGSLNATIKSFLFLFQGGGGVLL